jgi:hypothetical protein
MVVAVYWAMTTMAGQGSSATAIDGDHFHPPNQDDAKSRKNTNEKLSA